MEATRIEIFKGPNKRGEYSIMVYWMANWPPNTRLEEDFDGKTHERGQAFLIKEKEMDRRWPEAKQVDLRSYCPPMTRSR